MITMRLNQEEVAEIQVTLGLSLEKDKETLMKIVTGQCEPVDHDHKEDLELSIKVKHNLLTKIQWTLDCKRG